MSLQLRVIILLFISTRCYGMCPKSLQRSGASRQASSIPEGEVEKAFQEAEVRIRFRNEHERILKNERIIMKEKSRSPKAAYHREKISSIDHQADRKELVYMEASNILAQKYKLPFEEVYCELSQRQDSGEVSKQNITCDPLARYRTADGSCNHLDNPTWGKAGTCHQRLMPPYFAGVCEIISLTPSTKGFEPLYRSSCETDNGEFWETKDCGERPPPRDISEDLFSGDNCSNSKTLNVMQVIFSQFIAHDCVRTQGSGGDPCCGSSQGNTSSQCAVITVSDDDSFYSQQNITCMEFKRSAECPNEPQGERCGINTVTPVFDGSPIYGNSVEETDSLRMKDGSGKLKSQITDHGELLPNCSQSGGQDTCEVCYETGDSRGQQHAALTAIHTLCVIQHNRIADMLKEINPHWDDERMFQEARQVVIALIQRITYMEYLGPVVGPKTMSRYNLEITPGRTVCDNETNPSMYEEFVIAFRYGHYLINEEVYEDSNGTSHLLRQTYFCADFLQKGGLKYVIKGMISKPAARFDSCVVPDVRNYLLRRGQGPGRDLSAVDVQRGRDHGIPPYIVFVEFCLNFTIQSFDDLETYGLMTKYAVKYLQCRYRTVMAIDFFTAIGFEKPVEGGIVGPTVACILGIQFKKMKEGDCHWFQDRNRNNNGALTDAQLEAIMPYTFAKFICDTVNITDIPERPMLLPSANNPMRRCEDLPGLDLTAWKDPVPQENE